VFGRAHCGGAGSPEHCLSTTSAPGRYESTVITAKSMVSFALLIAVLALRPQGLFARR
jgi:branched-subunit amino acid ABC-type transport system permease component